MGRPRSCHRDTRTGDSENPVHCAPSSGMVTRSKSCGASTGASLARKLLSRGASLVCETICGTPSRQQALVLSPSRHRPCLTRCAALRCVGNNPRIHCLQPLNSCLPSAGCRTVPLAVNWRPADQTAGTTGSPSTADSIATIRSCQRRAKTGLVRRSKY